MYNNPKYKYQFYTPEEGDDRPFDPVHPIDPEEETNSNTKKSKKKNLITTLKSALVTLGIGSEENYNNKNLVKNLKELAVVAGAADSMEDINSNSIVEILDYIAENGESITGTTPIGTKNITANGTYDVKEFASANVNVKTPFKGQKIKIVSQLGRNITISFVDSNGRQYNQFSSTKEIPVAYSGGGGIYNYEVMFALTSYGTITDISATEGSVIFAISDNTALCKYMLQTSVTPEEFSTPTITIT